MGSVIDIIPNDIKHIIDRIKYDEVITEFRNTWIKRWRDDREQYFSELKYGNRIISASLLQWRYLSKYADWELASIYSFTKTIKCHELIKTGVCLPKRY